VKWTAIAVGLAAVPLVGSGSVGAEARVPADDQCAVCHAEIEDVDVGAFFQTDIHARSGLACADCHGGDRTAAEQDAAMSEAAGFRGAPDALGIPVFCGRCHADPEIMRRYNPGLPVDQLELYRTSRHGRRNAAGDPDVATCVSCHGVHDIRPSIEPKSLVHPRNVAETCGRCHSDANLMGRHDLPVDQVDRYLTSVHWQALAEGGDLSAPTCNDCHGNHGALPPEVESIASVCGHCHAYNRELFTKSPKKALFDDAGLPECETCHGNHGIQRTSEAMVGLDEEAVCANCHADDDSKSSSIVVAMRTELDALRTAVEHAQELLRRASEKGMYVTRGEFTWNDSRQKLFEARTTLHLFDLDALRRVCGEGRALADSARADGEDALADFRFRRNGLLVSTLIITLLALALYGKIRQIERK
jgi:predicted CXXCH cytochrome family protein